jgi:hypothetical protein
MQDPETYNLTQVIQQVRNMKTVSHAGDKKGKKRSRVAGAPNGAPARL